MPAVPAINAQFNGSYDQAVITDPCGNVVNTGNFTAEQTASTLQLGKLQTRSAVQTDASAGIFITPFIGDLYADASGKVGVLQQQTVMITGIDSIFDLTATVDQAIRMVKAFEVLDVNGVPNPESWGAAEDVSAHVMVNMVNDASGDFKSALAEIIANAGLVSEQNNGEAAVATLYKYLKHEARRDTVDILSYDGLADLLEGSDMLAFDIAVDASQGATSMYSKLSTHNWARNTQLTQTILNASEWKRRRALFTQLPQENIHKYAIPSLNDGVLKREHVTKMAFLPLLKGDVMVYVFDVTVGQYTLGQANPQVPTLGADMSERIVADAQYNSIAGSLTDPAGTITNSMVTTNDYSNGDLLFTVPTKRRIALKVKIDGTDGEVLGNTELSTGTPFFDAANQQKTEYVLSLVTQVPQVAL